MRHNLASARSRRAEAAAARAGALGGCAALAGSLEPRSAGGEILPVGRERLRVLLLCGAVPRQLWHTGFFAAVLRDLKRRYQRSPGQTLPFELEVRLKRIRHRSKVRLQTLHKLLHRDLAMSMVHS